MPFVVLGLLLLVRIIREYLGLGFDGINLLGYGLLVAGWVIGHLLGEADHLFYALMCNPQELSCTRVRGELAAGRYKSAWKLLKETAPERTRLPVHNFLSLSLVCLMGFWMATAATNVLALGVVSGLAVRLIWDMWIDAYWQKWYWLIAREFSLTEHKIVRGVLTGMILFQLLGLVR